MTADRFGDGQARPNALSALIEILDRESLIQILAKQDRQIVLLEADQALLSLQPRGERVHLCTQIDKTPMICNGKGSL